jgi:hypothetical protein
MAGTPVTLANAVEGDCWKMCSTHSSPLRHAVWSTAGTASACGKVGRRQQQVEAAKKWATCRLYASRLSEPVGNRGSLLLVREVTSFAQFR